MRHHYNQHGHEWKPAKPARRVNWLLVGIGVGYLAGMGALLRWALAYAGVWP